MKIVLEMRTGDFRLEERGADIGWLRGGVVVFHGFADRDDAALAALVAGAALERSRRPDGGRGPVGEALLTGSGANLVEKNGSQVVMVGDEPIARIVLDTDSETPIWRIELDLKPEETREVFALAKARVVWRAFRSHGVDGRMVQFADRAEAQGIGSGGPGD